LCSENLEEHSAIQLCQTVDQCLPSFRVEAMWILIHRMQSTFESLFKHKEDADARKWRWMKLFAHLCRMKTSCGKQCVSFRVISEMLYELTRDATCEDISCLSTFFEICGRTLDSEPNAKGYLDTIFRVLSKEIKDADVKRQFDKLSKWRSNQWL